MKEKVFSKHKIFLFAVLNWELIKGNRLRAPSGDLKTQTQARKDPFTAPIYGSLLRSKIVVHLAMSKPSMLRLLPAAYSISLCAKQLQAAQPFQELCLECATMEGFPPPQANRKHPS